MKNKEYTTIQIYREDLQTVIDMCKKNENLRDKLHEVILRYSKIKVKKPGIKSLVLPKSLPENKGAFS
jgi:hypothetical protein